MDLIKEAFSKIKNDIIILKDEIESIKSNQLKSDEIIEQIKLLSKKIESFNKITIPTQDFFIPTHNPTIPTQNISFPTHNPTIPTQNNIVISKINTLEGLKDQKTNFSIRNDGVPTNKPTLNQTNQQTEITTNSNNNYIQGEISTSFEKANEILTSLDDIKKDIRRTFKQLTTQEMLVFSIIYGYVEKNVEEITYRIIAEKLKLSESSIRDYTNRLIKKGIPIEKRRLNNKRIVLTVSKTLLEVTNLNTIKKLRAI